MNRVKRVQALRRRGYILLRIRLIINCLHLTFLSRDHLRTQRIVKIFLNTVRILLHFHIVDLVALVVGAHLLSLTVGVIQGHRLHDFID